MAWKSVDRREPCPVCGRSDNCRITDDGEFVWCGRVEEHSFRQNAGGQFLHRIGDGPDKIEYQHPGHEKPYIDWDYRVRQSQQKLTWSRCEWLARELHVSPIAIRRCGIGYEPRTQAYVFPEKNGIGTVVGLTTRFPNGAKVRAKYSSAGLFYADDWDSELKSLPAIIVEGATDVLCALSKGYIAIGRPNNLGGAEMLEALLKRTDRECIVLGENDKKASGCLANCGECNQCWPGFFGAKRIADRLNLPLLMPPEGRKDFRDWATRCRPGISRFFQDWSKNDE